MENFSRIPRELINDLQQFCNGNKCIHCQMYNVSTHDCPITRILAIGFKSTCGECDHCIYYPNDEIYRCEKTNMPITKSDLSCDTFVPK